MPNELFNASDPTTSTRITDFCDVYVPIKSPNTAATTQNSKNVTVKGRKNITNESKNITILYSTFLTFRSLFIFRINPEEILPTVSKTPATDMT